MNLNRWFAILKEFKADDREWHSRLLAMVFTCIQLDMFKNDTIASALNVTKTVKWVVEKPDSRSSKKEQTPEQRRLAASSANLLITSALVHLDSENQNMARMICAVLEPMELWQGVSNQTLRHADASLPWLLEQLAGAGVQVCCGAFQILELPDSLRHIGLTQAVGPAGGSQLDAGSVVRDNEMASTMGKLALAVASEFLTREIWRIRGWPTGMAPLTTATTGLVAEKVVSRFHADYDRWVFLKQQVCNTGFPRQPQGEHLCWSISFLKNGQPQEPKQGFQQTYHVQPL